MADNNAKATATIEELMIESQDAVYCMIQDYMRRSGCAFGTAVGIVQDGITQAVRTFAEQESKAKEERLARIKGLR